MHFIKFFSVARAFPVRLPHLDLWFGANYLIFLIVVDLLVLCFILKEFEVVIKIHILPKIIK